MRLRRRIIGLIRKLIFAFIVLVVGGGLVAFGLFLPKIFGGFGINTFYLRIAGFGIVMATVVIFIALFEAREHA